MWRKHIPAIFFRKYEMTFINLKYEEEDDVRKFYVL